MDVVGETHKNAFPEWGYRAFLLRCGQEAVAGPDDEPVWRFALAQAGSEGTQRGFASLEDLGDYLRGQLNLAAKRAESPLGNSVHQPENSPSRISEPGKECG
jgi:hypothetical protein